MDNTELKVNANIVSDVVTYPGLNKDERYIHCSIGGVRQPARKLSQKDNERLDEVVDRVRVSKDWNESRSFRFALAMKYYKAEIAQASQGQDQAYGFKR